MAMLVGGRVPSASDHTTRLNESLWFKSGVCFLLFFFLFYSVFAQSTIYDFVFQDFKQRNYPELHVFLLVGLSIEYKLYFFGYFPPNVKRVRALVALPDWVRWQLIPLKMGPFTEIVS